MINSARNKANYIAAFNQRNLNAKKYFKMRLPALSLSDQRLLRINHLWLRGETRVT